MFSIKVMDFYYHASIYIHIIFLCECHIKEKKRNINTKIYIHISNKIFLFKLQSNNIFKSKGIIFYKLNINWHRIKINVKHIDIYKLSTKMSEFIENKVNFYNFTCVNLRYIHRFFSIAKQSMLTIKNIHS